MKFLIIVFTLITISSKAQRTSFIGAWKFNEAKALLGEVPKWLVAEKLTVTESGGQMVLGRILFAKDSSAGKSYTEIVPLDGSEVTIKSPINNAEYSMTFKYVATEAGLFIRKTADTDSRTGGRSTEYWTIQENGNVLHVKRSVEQNNGLKYSTEFYYDRVK